MGGQPSFSAMGHLDNYNIICGHSKLSAENLPALFGQTDLLISESCCSCLGWAKTNFVAHIRPACCMLPTGGVEYSGLGTQVCITRWGHGCDKLTHQPNMVEEYFNSPDKRMHKEKYRFTQFTH